MQIEVIKKIIEEKITGKWEARHTDKGHRYCELSSGYIVDSVTTKLGILSKNHLMAWAIRQGALWLLDGNRLNQFATESSREDMIKGMLLAHTNIRDDASDVGSQTHSSIERWLNEAIFNGEIPEDITKFAPPNCDPRAIAAMRGVQKLHQDKNIIPIATEILVGDRRYSCGQLDYLCMWGDEGLTLVDWKSSNQISQEYILQTVAYKKFFESMTGLKINKVKILHLDKGSDKYTIYKVSGIPQAWKAFKNVCNLYEWKKDQKNKPEKDRKKLVI